MKILVNNRLNNEKILTKMVYIISDFYNLSDLFSLGLNVFI